MTIRIITMYPYKVGPCRVLAEGGCMGGLLAPRFQFSYFSDRHKLLQSLPLLNSDFFDLPVV